MELRNLITFIRLAEVGNFTQAARQLGYSQSAVTVQIKQLETELGAPLFDRLGKRVRLTEAGQRLLPHALEVLNSLQKAQQIMASPADVRGQLRIGTSESLLNSSLLPLLLDFHRICPHVSIQTQLSSPTETLFEFLRQNEVDFVLFLQEKVYFPEFVKVFEYQEPLLFVASPRFPLPSKSPIPLDRLSRLPFVLTEKEAAYRSSMEQALAAKGIALHPFLETGNSSFIIKVLLSGEAISFLPRFAVSDHLRRGTLVEVPVDCPPFCAWTQMVYHKSRYVSVAMKHFMDLATRHLTPAPEHA